MLSTVEQDPDKEAGKIESLAQKSLSGDKAAANELAREVHSILSSSDPIYTDALNRKLAADRKQQGASFPDMSIDDASLNIKKGKDEQYFFADGEVKVSAGDKLRPAVNAKEIGFNLATPHPENEVPDLKIVNGMYDTFKHKLWSNEETEDEFPNGNKWHTKLDGKGGETLEVKDAEGKRMWSEHVVPDKMGGAFAKSEGPGEWDNYEGHYNKNGSFSASFPNGQKLNWTADQTAMDGAIPEYNYRAQKKEDGSLAVKYKDGSSWVKDSNGNVRVYDKNGVLGKAGEKHDCASDAYLCTAEDLITFDRLAMSGTAHDVLGRHKRDRDIAARKDAIDSVEKYEEAQNTRRAAEELFRKIAEEHRPAFEAAQREALEALGKSRK